MIKSSIACKACNAVLGRKNMVAALEVPKMTAPASHH